MEKQQSPPLNLVCSTSAVDDPQSYLQDLEFPMNPAYSLCLKPNDIAQKTDLNQSQSTSNTIADIDQLVESLVTTSFPVGNIITNDHLHFPMEHLYHSSITDEKQKIKAVQVEDILGLSDEDILSLIAKLADETLSEQYGEAAYETKEVHDNKITPKIDNFYQVNNEVARVNQSDRKNEIISFEYALQQPETKGVVEVDANMANPLYSLTNKQLVREEGKRDATDFDSGKRFQDSIRSQNKNVNMSHTQRTGTNVQPQDIYEHNNDLNNPQNIQETFQTEFSKLNEIRGGIFSTQQYQLLQCMLEVLNGHEINNITNPNNPEPVNTQIGRSQKEIPCSEVDPDIDEIINFHCNQEPLRNAQNNSEAQKVSDPKSDQKMANFEELTRKQMPKVINRHVDAQSLQTSEFQNSRGTSNVHEIPYIKANHLQHNLGNKEVNVHEKGSFILDQNFKQNSRKIYEFFKQFKSKLWNSKSEDAHGTKESFDQQDAQNGVVVDEDELIKEIGEYAPSSLKVQALDTASICSVTSGSSTAGYKHKRNLSGSSFTSGYYSIHSDNTSCLSFDIEDDDTVESAADKPNKLSRLEENWEDVPLHYSSFMNEIQEQLQETKFKDSDNFEQRKELDGLPKISKQQKPNQLSVDGLVRKDSKGRLPKKDHSQVEKDYRERLRNGYNQLKELLPIPSRKKVHYLDILKAAKQEITRLRTKVDQQNVAFDILKRQQKMF